MIQRLLGYFGLTLAIAAALLTLFTAKSLREPLLAFGDEVPALGMLLVSHSWLAWLMPIATVGVLLALRSRTPMQRGMAVFVAGAVCVVLALAWVGFGALLPLWKLEAAI